MGECLDLRRPAGPAKSARHREQAIAADQVCVVVRSLKRRRGGGDQVLVFRSGPRWHHVTAADINDYLRELTGGDYTAKDFRTWHATVLAESVVSHAGPCWFPAPENAGLSGCEGLR